MRQDRKCVHGFGEGENVECCLVGGWQGWWGLQWNTKRESEEEQQWV